MATMSDKILFIIPVYKHNPKVVIDKIRSTFPQSEIIIIDDGQGVQINNLDRIEIIRHQTNMGLAKSLINGYERAIQKNSDYIIKIDADLEYPIYPIKSIINILDRTKNTSGSYVELKRSISTNGIVDGLFHIVFGIIEGLLLIKKRMYQHSPGLHIYKRQTMVEIFPKAKKIYQSTKVNWGLDLVFLHLANHEGKLISYTISNHKWMERRSRLKIFKQVIATFNLLIYLKYYSIINSIKAKGTLDINLPELAFEEIIVKDTIL